MRSPWVRALRVFAFLLGASFVSASAGYLLLRGIMGDRWWVFGALPRMFAYHWEHPYQYIALITAVYALLATVVIQNYPRLTGVRQAAVILGIMLSTVVISSVPGGVLWKIHDMQAGYFPEGERFWSDLEWGAMTGLSLGWAIIGLSVPYNLIGLVVGYLITRRAFRLARTATEGEVSSSQVTALQICPLLF